MVYECECGCVLKQTQPCKIQKHLDSDKHIILINGGTSEEVIQARVWKSNMCPRNLELLRQLEAKYKIKPWEPK